MMANSKSNNSCSYYEPVTEIFESCKICYGGSTSSPIMHGSCGHSFCKVCFTEYFTIKWQENEIYHLVCPRCNCNQDVYKCIKILLMKIC